MSCEKCEPKFEPTIDQFDNQVNNLNKVIAFEIQRNPDFKFDSLDVRDLKELRNKYLGKIEDKRTKTT